MNDNLDGVEKLFFSDEFSSLDSYAIEFDLFRMMGVRNKELIHSNILACLLNPAYPHGLGHLFVNTFTRSLNKLNCLNAEPIPLSVLIASTNTSIRVFRELENIDLVVEYPESQLVFAIENKIWAEEQENQIKRYQQILESRYSGYRKALIYLTPSGKEPKTVNKDSMVPVYCMSYERIATALRHVATGANKSASFFINQFISHVERYMSGSSEIKDLCWQIYQKHEDAYLLIVNSHSYCVSRKIKELFTIINQKLKSDIMFSTWSDVIETTENYRDHPKHKVICDLDMRLKSWPKGLWIKIYKHGWFGVFPYVSNKDKENVKDIIAAFGVTSIQQARHWDNLYYVSGNNNLDKERKVLSSGNELSKEDIDVALNRVKEFIIELNSANTVTKTSMRSE